MTQLYQYLLLARISNLPTVWSNVAAALAISASFNVRTATTLAAAMSALYIAGMFLNDAFDQEHDAQARPGRPLPSGRVAARHVWLAGFGLLVFGVTLVSITNADAGILGLALAGAILLYDAWHKSNPFAPVVMGACRGLVYLTAAAAAGATLSDTIAIAALALAAYVAGLTYMAREENLDSVSSWWPLPLILAAPLTAFVLQPGPLMGAACVAVLCILGQAMRLLVRRGAGDVKSAVSLLIAAIALIDALFALAVGQSLIGALCIGAFLLTLYLQRFVPGT